MNLGPAGRFAVVLSDTNGQPPPSPEGPLGWSNREDAAITIYTGRSADVLVGCVDAIDLDKAGEPSPICYRPTGPGLSSRYVHTPVYLPPGEQPLDITITIRDTVSGESEPHFLRTDLDPDEGAPDLLLAD
jgi:hypothetical protein